MPATSEKMSNSNESDHSLENEDDDFEEFPAEDWQTKEESFPVWEDNWDDDDVEEDFHQQLMQQKGQI